VKKPCR